MFFKLDHMSNHVPYFLEHKPLGLINEKGRSFEFRIRL